MTTMVDTADHGSMQQSTASLASLDDSSKLSLSTISSDVDHIRDLVSLSSLGPHEGIAQSVFRRTSRVHIGQSQVLKELDRLQRRIHRLEEGDTADDSAQDAVETLPQPVLPTRDRSQVQNLEAELAKVRREREEWLEDAELRVDKAQDEITRLEATRKTTAAELTQLRDRLSTRDSKIDRLEAESAESKGKLRDVHQRLEAAESARGAAQAEQESLQSKHAEELTSWKESCDRLNTDLETLKETLEGRLKRQSADADRALAEFRDKAQGELEQLRGSHRKELETIKAELVEKHERVLKSARQETAGVRQELTDLHARSERELAEASEKASSDLAGMRSEHEKKLAELTNSHKSEKTKLEKIQHDLEQKHAKKLSATERDAANRIETLQRSSKEEVAKAKSDAEFSMQSLKKSHEKDLAEHAKIKAKLTKSQQDLENQEKRHTTALDELRAEHEQAVFRRDEEHQAKIREKEDARSKMVQELTANIKSKDGEHDSAMKLLKDQHEQALQRLKEDHERAVTKHRETRDKEHQKAVQNLKEQHEKALQQSALDHESALANQQKTSDREYHEAVQGQKAEHEEALRQSQREHESALAKQNESSGKEHQEALKSVKAQHEEALRQSQTKHEGELATHREEISKEHQEAVRVLKDQHEEKLRQSKVEADKLVNEMKDQCARVEAKHKSRMEKQAGQHAQALADLKAQLKQDHTAALSDLKDTHAKTLEDLRIEHAAELKKHTSEHTSELDQVRRSHDVKLTEAEKCSKKVQDELDTLRASQEETMADTFKKHEKETAELRAAVQNRQEAVEKAQEQHLKEIAEMKERHEAGSKTLRAEVDESKKAANDAQKKLADLDKRHKGDIERAAANHKDQTAKSEAAHKDYVSKLDASHKRQITNLETTHKDHIATLESTGKDQMAEVETLAKQVKDLKARASAEQTRANGEAETRKSEQQSHVAEIERMKKDRNEAFRQAVTQATARHEAHVKIIRSDHEKELKAATDSASDEVARLKQEHADALEKATKDAKEGHTDDIEKIRRDHEQSLSNLRAEHDTKSADLRKSHASELESQKSGLEAQIDTLRQESKMKLDALERRRSQEVSEALMKSTEKTQESTNEHQKQLNILRDKLTSEKSVVQERLQSTLTDHQKLASECERMVKEIQSLEERSKQADVRQREVEAEYERKVCEKEKRSEDLERMQQECEEEQKPRIEKGRMATQEADAPDVSTEEETPESEKSGDEKHTGETDPQTEQPDERLEVLQRQVSTVCAERDAAIREMNQLLIETETLQEALRTLNESAPEGPVDAHEKVRSQQHRGPDSQTISTAARLARLAVSSRTVDGVSFEQAHSDAQTRLAQLNKTIEDRQAAFVSKISVGSDTGSTSTGEDEAGPLFRQRLIVLMEARSDTDADATKHEMEELDKTKRELRSTFADTLPTEIDSSDVKNDMEVEERAANKTRMRLFEQVESRLELEHKTRLIKRKIEIATGHLTDLTALSGEYYAAMGVVHDEHQNQDQGDAAKRTGGLMPAGINEENRTANVSTKQNLQDSFTLDTHSPRLRGSSPIPEEVETPGLHDPQAGDGHQPISRQESIVGASPAHSAHKSDIFGSIESRRGHTRGASASSALARPFSSGSRYRRDGHDEHDLDTSRPTTRHSMDFPPSRGTWSQEDGKGLDLTGSGDFGKRNVRRSSVSRLNRKVLKMVGRKHKE